MPAGNRLCDADAHQILNYVLRAATPTWPSSWYFALLTTAPSDDTGTGAVEVVGGSYARVALVRNTTNFAAAATRQGKNAVAIQWPTATADWAAGATKVVGVALYDAASAGTYRGYGALTTAVNVLTGGAPVIAISNFILTG